MKRLLAFWSVLYYVAVIKKSKNGIRSSPLNLLRFSRGSIPITDEIKAIPINIERDITIGFKVMNGSDFRSLNSTQQMAAIQKEISLSVVVWGNMRRKR